MLSLLGGVALAVAAVVWYGLWLPGRSHPGPWPPPTAAEESLAPVLRNHVETIAGAPHNLWHYENLERAADHIETTLAEAGHRVERQVYRHAGREVRNIWVRLPATAGDPGGTLVLGAHYDSVADAPGANDNGSGVAVLLALAEALGDHRPARTPVILAFFVNEEPPWFDTPAMGSLRFARMLKAQGERVQGMVSLETIGWFDDAPGSQAYPPPLGLVYPDRGDFLAFVAMPGSRAFLHRLIGAFRASAAVPSIGGVVPGVVPGVAWSDHKSFADLGWPAVMVTDTAPFRYPHYHRPTDTPDRVDYPKLARIALAFAEVVRELAPE